MITAALVIQSSDLSLDEITATMAREPDAGYDRGSVALSSKVIRKWTSWSMDLAWPRGTHGGTEGLAVAIESLGELVAARVAKLAARGCDVVVSVRQELADDPAAIGLHLTPSAIKWIALAGAAIDVDQYVEHDRAAP
jgi:hypothetical protein